MFSGIIQTKGRVSQVHQQGLEMTLTITAPSLMTPSLKIGDSIAVNGICLTVTTRQADAFSVVVMPETVRRTNLKILVVGSLVNLERALQVNAHLDGHIVEGNLLTRLDDLVDRRASDRVVDRLKNFVGDVFHRLELFGADFLQHQCLIEFDFF